MQNIQNKTLRKFSLLLPFILFFALFGLLGRELLFAKPNVLPSALIGENVPRFTLSTLYQPHENFTEKDLIGKVSLLNIWATWCYACKLEQSMLLKIKNDYHVSIFAINYKDNPAKAKEWLQNAGNPYVIIGNDLSGDTAIDLGVYGTPETFVINRSGKIVYRHVGVIDQATWDTVLFPLIKKIESETYA